MAQAEYERFENTSVAALNASPGAHPTFGALALPEVSYIVGQGDNGPSPTQAQFRFLAAPSHYLKDDPIVFPNQIGRSHLHMFFGNTRADANSVVGSGDANDLLIRGASTVQGGKGANASSYWIPALVDGPLNGCANQRKIILPDSITIYYKTRRPAETQLIPEGLATIGGNLPQTPNGMVHGMRIENSGGGDFREGALWGFYDPARGLAVDIQPTIPQSNPNGYRWLRASIGFPQCFASEVDGGFRLRSTDHLSHQHMLEDSGGWNRDDLPCPASHPNRIPKIEILVDFRWPADNDVSGWRLSSDMGADTDAQVPFPGGSLHGDILFAWNEKVQQAWKGECLDAADPRNCSLGQTGTQWNLDRIGNTATINNMVYTGDPTLPDPFDCADNCPPAGTPCDDENPYTTGDMADGNCGCAGTCLPAGTACNDDNPLTQNDVLDGNCNCAGTIEPPVLPPPPNATTCAFSTGTTLTRDSMDPWGDAAAVARGQTLVLNSTKIVNQHLMAFGATNPEPSPDEYDFSSLIRRIGTSSRLGQEADTIVLTACCAPDWMKGGNPGETNWSIEWIERRPLTEHFDDFAELVAEAVSHPELTNITHVQVWNEMKGFWDTEANEWNHKDYTDLYNKIWNAVKAVRRDIKIGGPYVVLGSYGDPTSGEGQWFSSPAGGDWGKFDARDLKAVDYWLRNKVGADFITIDAHNTNKDGVHPTDAFARTIKFADSLAWLREHDEAEYPGATTLPVWWAEWYVFTEDPNASHAEKNALMATSLSRMIKSGASTALLWGPQGDAAGEMFPLALFNDTRIPGGGQATAFHPTQKMLHDHFPPGTALIDASPDNADVEVLASSTKTMLINTRGSARTVTIRGLTVTLAPFEVRLLDTPQAPGDACNVINNGSFNTGVGGWTRWNCDIAQVAGRCEITGIQDVPNLWNAALAQSGLSLVNGQRYEIRFDAASFQNTKTIHVKVGLGVEPFTPFADQAVPLNPVTQAYAIPFTMEAPSTNQARLEFQVGADTNGLVVDNIQLIPLSGDCDPDRCDQVRNGDFAAGTTGWVAQNCTATPNADGVDISMSTPFPDWWNVALRQSGLSYENGKEYRVTFEAQAAADRTIRVKAGKATAPNDTYHLETLELTPTRRYYAYSFTMEDPTDRDAFFEFFFGDSTTGLSLGNISLEAVDCFAGGPGGAGPLALQSRAFAREGMLRWNSEIGVTYVVEESLDLALDEWRSIHTVTADAILTEFVPIPPTSRCFYRIREE